MSWSFQCVGKPANVAAAIEAQSDKLSGQSKLEFDAAKPHLIALVSENFVKEGSGYTEAFIDFEASGSGIARGTGDTAEQTHRSCQVSIKPIWKNFV